MSQAALADASKGQVGLCTWRMGEVPQDCKSFTSCQSAAGAAVTETDLSGYQIAEWYDAQFTLYADLCM